MIKFILDLFVWLNLPYGQAPKLPEATDGEEPTGEVLRQRAREVDLKPVTRPVACATQSQAGKLDQEFWDTQT